MRKYVGALLPLVLVILSMTAGAVFAAGTGSLRISPSLPIKVDTPATFETWVQPGCDSVSDPHIFLVMTQNCYDGLTGDVTLDWTGDGIADLTIAKSDWMIETVNSIKVPPGTTDGAGYTVASLKDHLQTSEPIYWVFKPFLTGDITDAHKTFTVTLPSTDPALLVYDLGKCDQSDMFNVRVPPTIPGFVVPEPMTIAAIAAPLAALGGYAVIRKRR